MDRPNLGRFGAIFYRHRLDLGASGG